MVELVFALAVLGLAVLPLAFSFFHEQKLCRAYYYRAVVMEILDGEIEILAAGEWQAFREGAQTYRVRAESAKNLPNGRFMLTLRGPHARLEWQPQKTGRGGQVAREATLR